MKRVLLTTVAVGLTAASPGLAATVTNWNVSNVDVGDTPADGVTGESVVYDQVLPAGGSVPNTATTNGKVVFTPPEAISPGITVSNVAYPDSGTGTPPRVLDGCIKTSSAAACDGPFQSGKRIKQVVTDTGPMDLVFDIDPTSTTTSTYQVFGRLINDTGQALEGFELELGYGIGDDFVAASPSGNLTFSTTFTAQPSGSGSSNTQFPFGLFGEADTNPNFLLDGFFSDERTGLNVAQTETTISSTDFFGEYASIFGPWMTQDEATLPVGLFLDFDDNEDTDDLLMAWEIAPGEWELRRDAGLTCDVSDPLNCTEGATRDTFATGALDEIVALLGVDADLLGTGAIEDLANLNVNYGIALGDLSAELGTGFFASNQPSFTLRTTVSPTNSLAAVPLPASAPLILPGLGMLGFLRRSRVS